MMAIYRLHNFSAKQLDINRSVGCGCN